jgi:hypothetical protein
MSSSTVSYATGLCVAQSDGSSYFYDVNVASNNVVTYRYTNYTGSKCEHLDKTVVESFQNGQCLVRTTFSSGDFDFPYYYYYAKYYFSSNPSVPTPLYSGLLK